MNTPTALLAQAAGFHVMLVFLAGAVGKLTGFHRFVSTLEALPFSIPTGWTVYVAGSVILVEGAIAASILADGESARAGMIAALGLCLAFSAIVCVVVAGRMSVTCNCFGSNSHRMSGLDLLRNAGLMASALAWLRFSEIRPPLLTFDTLLMFGVAMSASLISIFLPDLMTAVRRPGATD
ncbi:MAG: MauE/DoxX family redox-associated membrane protein [Brevundimonas sp.]|jgi:hypothetical protein